MVSTAPRLGSESDFHYQAGTPLDLRLIGPLIEAGADVNGRSTLGGRRVTPLDIAVDYVNQLAMDAITQCIASVQLPDLGSD